MTTSGIVQIAIGERAQFEQQLSAETIRRHSGLPIHVFTKSIDGLTPVQSSRWYKVNLDLLTPFDRTLYLDADTRTQGDLSAFFAALDSGWDIAICPSTNQGPGEHLWHVRKPEREATYLRWGCVPTQLQAGVFCFERNERTALFFAAWRMEWEKWRDQDQAAFLRALDRAPVRAWLLGWVYNGGSVIQHLFGRARSD